MPHVAFNQLPPDARVWVFGSSVLLEPGQQKQLLAAVDEHLSQWRAHGVPLVCSREFRDQRFVAIGVDEAATGASGCSIDGLFRTLQQLQSVLGASLVGGGAVYYRDQNGEVQCVDRSGFSELAKQRVITRDTMVFDLTVATVDGWRAEFEKRAAESWHGRLVGV